MKTMKNSTHSVKKAILIFSVCLGAIFVSKAQNFEYKTTGTDFILYDLAIPEGQNDIAYAAGSKFTFDTEGIIIKTVDGGETWTTIYPTSGTSPSFEKIEFVSETKGFVAGYDIFMKTEDAGATWTPMTVGTDVYLYNNLSFYDENIGFVSAQLNDAPFFAIYLTTDGGDTWTAATDVMDAGGINVGYADQTTLYSVGADERIAKSTDGGNTWTQIYSGVIQNYFLSLHFKDADNGVIAGEDGLLKTTHDGGTTWSDFATGYHHFYALAYKGDQIMAGGTDTDIYFSEDNGANWDQILVGNGQNQLYEIAFFEDGSGLICGSGGVMIKFDDVFLGTNDHQFIDESLIGFYNEHTQNFEIRASKGKLDTVQLFNLNGQLLGTYENQNELCQINAAHLSNGLYIAHVSSEGRTSSLKVLKR